VAEELAREFGLSIYNGGDILKAMAGEKGFTVTGKDWWDSEGASRFMLERQHNLFFDKEVDRKLIKIADLGNAVITSYTLPWLTDNAVNLWLSGSQDSRVRRMANRDGIKVVDARRIVGQRDSDNKKIYRKLYNIEFGDDLSVFDFSFNTDLLELQFLIDLAKRIIRHILIE
jgi:cytidylate kinase